jgi:hypothetical protein
MPIRIVADETYKSAAAALRRVPGEPAGVEGQPA